MIFNFRRITLAILALLFTLAVAGCGQKGPLFVPDSEKTEESEKTIEEIEKTIEEIETSS